MSHSRTPPYVPPLPAEAIRKMAALNPGLRCPEVDAWLAAQLAYDEWKTEEKKRDDFVEKIRNSIYWNDQELDEGAIRSLFERTISAAKNGEL